jgi:hypothetical protein
LGEWGGGTKENIENLPKYIQSHGLFGHENLVKTKLFIYIVKRVSTKLSTPF